MVKGQTLPPLVPKEIRLAARPFLRWAGSKRWLATTIAASVAGAPGAYYEPFLGSASAYFALSTGTQSYLSDTLEPLIECYSGVRDYPEDVARILNGWPRTEASYYQVRGERLSDPVERAAQLIYLNLRCFNGLYRVNSKGQFNVPYGRPKNERMITGTQLEAVAERLRNNTQVRHCDFEVAVSTCRPGDFVYFDPPYVAGHRNNGFVDYNAQLFSWQDQERLARCAQELDSRGVRFVISNADHPSVTSLYSTFSVTSVARHSSMAARTTARGLSSEIVVSNFTFDFTVP